MFLISSIFFGRVVILSLKKWKGQKYPSISFKNNDFKDNWDILPCFKNYQRQILLVNPLMTSV
jgi:hypothetical protein